MTSAVHEARAMLALFTRSPWRDLHLRGATWDMFLAKPGGGANPMRATAGPSVTVDAPHLGLFFACVAAGAMVSAGTVVAQVEVLGEREDVIAAEGGRVVEVLAPDGALIEYDQPLVRIAA